MAFVRGSNRRPNRLLWVLFHAGMLMYVGRSVKCLPTYLRPPCISTMNMIQSVSLSSTWSHDLPCPESCCFLRAGLIHSHSNNTARKPQLSLISQLPCHIILAIAHQTSTKRSHSFCRKEGRTIMVRLGRRIQLWSWCWMHGGQR